MLFLALLLATWQRWTHPLVDHPREINVPLRLLQGERLYTDVFYFYGPLAPLTAATLYRILGVHLAILHATGAFCAVITLALYYWIARHLMARWEATIVSALVMVTCAFGAYWGNYIQPYAYGALYGWTAALGSLAASVRYVTTSRQRWLAIAGACTGIAAACKPEYGLLAGTPAALVVLVCGVIRQRIAWTQLVSLGAPAAAITTAAYLPLYLTIPWRVLVGDVWELFSQPQMVYFARLLSGTADPGGSAAAMTASLGMFMTFIAVPALVAFAWHGGVRAVATRVALHSWCLLGVGAVLWSLPLVVRPGLDVMPLRAAPLVLGMVAVVASSRIVQTWRSHETTAYRWLIVLCITLFGLVSIVRVPLNVSFRTSYTPFSIPAVLLIHSLILLNAARILVPNSKIRRHSRLLVTALLVGSLFVEGIAQVALARGWNTDVIGGPRGTMLTNAAYASPFMRAIRFVTERTASGEFVACLPYGTLINFLADRRNPLRDEIIVPGVLSHSKELDAIARMEERRVRVILVANSSTPAYRDVTFGRDYNQVLMSWIEDKFRVEDTFSSSGRADLDFGDPEFFIRAYVRRDP